MTDISDILLIKKFTGRCARAQMNLEEMGKAVGRTKAWASMIVSGKITHLQFRTRNSIVKYVGKP